MGHNAKKAESSESSFLPLNHHWKILPQDTIKWCQTPRKVTQGNLFLSVSPIPRGVFWVCHQSLVTILLRKVHLMLIFSFLIIHSGATSVLICPKDLDECKQTLSSVFLAHENFHEHSGEKWVCLCMCDVDSVDCRPQLL